ncbi:MAG: hypothetical protein ACW97X_09085 [Candidatus Hodarchaeales archaeon]
MAKPSFPNVKWIIDKFLIKKRLGISPVLATVIIFGLILAGVMLTFIQVIPYIEKAQSEENISSVRNSFLDLDTTIRSLLSESGSPGGFRTVLFTKPAGKIVFEDDIYHISLRLLDQSDNEVFSILESESVGLLDWIYNSPASVLPRGTSKYLTGTDPYKVRDPVFLTGPFASGVNNGITNLTLSHVKSDRKHHLTLNYRISVYLTISTNPEPEIKFQVFLVRLKSDFQDIYSSYEQIEVHSVQNISTPLTLDIDPVVSTLDLVWSTGARNAILWSTSSIQGLSQVNFFNVIVQTSIFEIGLSTS